MTAVSTLSRGSRIVELESRELERQLAVLRGPKPTLRLDRPAVPGDGIRRLDPRVHEALEAFHGEARAAGRLASFVPASGAATRLCKALTAAWQQEASDDERREVADLVAHAPELALWTRAAAHGARAGDAASILAALVGPRGLRLQDAAKALVPFHRTGGGVRTAFEEHLVEACLLGRDAAGVVRAHFTVGVEHVEAFEEALVVARRWIEPTHGVRLEVGFSVQDPRTDTIAVDGRGEPVRAASGDWLRRPGGHGALLANLADTHGDVVLVKNVDNVAPEADVADGVLWRRRLAGLLVQLQRHAHELVHALRQGRAVEAARTFVADELGLDLPADAEWLAQRLDRPWRVCGMVPVEGHVGGGPFWADSPDGVTLQIVEGTQVADELDQRAVLRRSTHFNPVDMALGLRDADGRPHDLRRFTDPAAAIVTTKHQDGRTLRVLEHPGLWNGGMARWNTVFVEIPASTFRPVKTLHDLLRPAHGGPLP